MLSKMLFKIIDFKVIPSDRRGLNLVTADRHGIGWARTIRSRLFLRRLIYL